MQPWLAWISEMLLLLHVLGLKACALPWSVLDGFLRTAKGRNSALECCRHTRTSNLQCSQISTDKTERPIWKSASELNSTCFHECANPRDPRAECPATDLPSHRGAFVLSRLHGNDLLRSVPAQVPFERTKRNLMFGSPYTQNQNIILYLLIYCYFACLIFEIKSGLWL